LIGGLVTLLLPVFLCLIFSLGWAEYHKRSLLHKYTLCLLYYIRNGNLLIFQIYEFLGHIGLSYAVAFVTSLAFESPMMGLEKVIFKRGQKK
jgi:hypothetical protein